MTRGCSCCFCCKVCIYTVCSLSHSLFFSSHESIYNLLSHQKFMLKSDKMLSVNIHNVGCLNV